MKYRADFVTNSSSSHWVVKNISSSTKTLWDLLEEAADGPWEFMWWEYDEPYEGRMRSPPDDPVRLQKFKEGVANAETFPPFTDVKVSLEVGNGGSGADIYLLEGFTTGKTKSFEIRYLYTAV